MKGKDNSTIILKINETLTMSDCTKAVCRGDNVVTLESETCPEQKPLSCASGLPPKIIEDGCCSYYECECVCSGWGDPHYITFDGTYYTFLDNCTYVLVQQITPKYDNFRVLVDNYFCDAEDGLSCPQSILVYYKSSEIVLTRMMYEGKMQNRIRLNNDWVTPGFTKDGITVSSAGINMNVEIPEIGAFISFSGMIFAINLPFSKFGYNTEGQCGTCSNNSNEDCRLPGGKIVEDCSQMANYWKVNVTGKPYCNSPPPTSPPTQPPPPPTCPPSDVCDIILSEVFADCQEIIDPNHYYDACAFDACRMRNNSEEIVCSSLEAYASLCIANGICVDWRSKTNGHCPYNCPAGKVYNPCGPMHVKTCENKEVQNSENDQTEGCFCPDGSMQFNSVTDVCVKSCIPPEVCVYNDNTYKLGTKIPQSENECMDCSCTDEKDPETSLYLVSCQPIICNTECDPGMELVHSEGECCGKCIYDTCVMKGKDNSTIILKINETLTVNDCTKAVCRGDNVVTLESETCPEQKPLSCASGLPPKIIEDGCCSYYECECVCSGWGDPHYITFDGTYYTFLDNCTYVLVQQITPKYDNFRVLVDNYFCDAEDGLSCPQSILVYYKSSEIVLTHMMYEGKMQNRIRWNNDWVTPGFTKDGITVSSAGINMNVEIPEIGAFISFSGMIFVINLPFSKFGYNTEGQCGTCSNNSNEDCRLPGGKIVEDCSQMANYWKVNVTGKPYCNSPPPTSPPTQPPPPPTCPPSDVCDIILSEVFADCHEIIDRNHYHEACAFDACRMRNNSEQIVCSSLEAYASLCVANGICVDWRNKTNGHCPYNCPAGKVYNPCGPMHVQTCENKEVQNSNNDQTEGCFCPEGAMLLNSVTDVCVKSCITTEVCVYNDNTYKLGTKIPQSENECMDCSCTNEKDPETSLYLVSCQPKICNTECDPGMELVHSEGECCGKCVHDTCVMKGKDNSTIILKINETLTMNDCTKAVCHGDNVVTLESETCPEQKPLSCASGLPPKIIEDGCCSYNECECVCSGWGDPHYITFDGTYYTFLDNCTYVLVQQITPKYDNFQVLVDNYFCDAEDGLSCPQSILVYYKSSEIVLTRMMYEGKMQNRIRWNNDWVTPGFTKDGITVSSAGINMNVEIPEIGAFISFSGMIFVIKLPFSKFGYNTEGQCGTCSNNSNEDCRLPDGKIVEDCSQMANYWKVNVTGKPYCNSPPPTSPPTQPPPPPTCPPSDVCDIILSEVFADCHKIIDPNHYYEACAFDACRMRNNSEEIVCSSLEAYASLCIANGICVDWRSKTNGHCPYDCPAGKVYNPCGPMHVQTCENKEVQNSKNDKTEGCYCPDGSMPFNSVTDVCVKDCIPPEVCVYNDNTYKAGTKIPQAENVCTDCSCTHERDPETLLYQVSCQPIICNTECEPGTELVHSEGDCCGKCIAYACIMSGKDNSTIILKPGETWSSPDKPCEHNECHSIEDQYVPVEVRTVCAIEQCDQGYAYKTVTGECCGKCVKEACVIHLSDNTTRIMEPEEKYVPPEDKCSTYTCSITYDVEKTRISCPLLDSTNCIEGTELVHSEDDCCGKCIPYACIMSGKDNSTIILKPGETWSSPDNPCEQNECHHIEDQYVPVAVRTVCAIEQCEQGYAYKTVPGECCGKCVKEACVIHLSDNTTRIMEPEEKYVPPEDKCSTYKCSSTYDVEKTTISCPLLDGSNCIEGTELIHSEDDCCGKCVPYACIMNGKDNSTIILKPGETWSSPDKPCEQNECHHIEDQYVPVAVRTVCAIEQCEQGYAYKTVPGECCGKCVKEACVIRLSDNTTRIMEPEEKYVPPEDKCSTYTCSSTYDVEKTSISCPLLDGSNCIEGTELVHSEDDCCGKCVPYACIMSGKDNSTIILKPGETWSSPDKPCEQNECHHIEDQYVSVAVRTVCSIEQCEQGYTYKTVSGECCGKCVKEACVIHLSDNTTRIMEPEETYVPPEDKCSTYTCSSTYDVEKTTISCPLLDGSNCIEGTELVHSDGDCCGKCVPYACIMSGKDNSTIILKPGETWSSPDKPCEQNECHHIDDQYVPVAVRTVCAIEQCEQGYAYETVPGECCGKCIKDACVIYLSDNTTRIMEPEEKYVPPEDKCSTYTCSSTYDVEKTSISCPLLDHSKCIEGTIKSDGCCESCEPLLSGCGVQKQSERIKTSFCETDEVVELSSCGGACMTSSIYSAEANLMEHTCSCCQEVKTSKREVNLKCLDGTSTVYTYIYVEECGCTHTECQSDIQTSSAQQHQLV
ncbi:mucin-5B-like [Ranitomeya imitator]|uniref:mucin-5B-like n=1 Tax=Ranitomeya imitator TaxID=111125 RepID=UPI0037E7F379